MIMMMMFLNADLLSGPATVQLSESQRWLTGKSDESPLGQEEKSSAHQPSAV